MQLPDARYRKFDLETRINEFDKLGDLSLSQLYSLWIDLRDGLLWWTEARRLTGLTEEQTKQGNTVEKLLEIVSMQITGVTLEVALRTGLTADGNSLENREKLTGQNTAFDRLFAQTKMRIALAKIGMPPELVAIVLGDEAKDGPEAAEENREERTLAELKALIGEDGK